MQPAAVQASLSLGLHALSTNLESEHSLGRRNVDIWGPVLSRSGPNLQQLSGGLPHSIAGSFRLCLTGQPAPRSQSFRSLP